MNLQLSGANRVVARRRIAAVVTGLALTAGPLATGLGALSAEAVTPRSATTSVDTTYLSDALGLASDTVLETVTYDRFQWLLQQPGQFAFVVGSTSDAKFKDSVQKAATAAKAAGVKKVYWFDPNLSGLTGAQNLDTRVPGDIKLAADSQAIFGRVWDNVLAQYLGNGTRAGVAANGTSVTLAADASVVNDAVDPVYDGVDDDEAAFILYDKDNVAGGKADKVVDWVNLSTATDVAAEVTAAVAKGTGGAAGVDALSQFQWWKAQTNGRHDQAYPDDNRYGGDIITDADEAQGWRVQQVTYPELLHVLDKKEAGANFVLLFGGTWCHNTRAVLKDVNREAQENGVQAVYNFDLVLDGAIVNGANGGTNPIHVRDNANRTSGGVSVTNFRPSHLYGDLVRKHLQNAVTEYDPNTGNRVAYYPSGDTAAFPDVVRKLQVPFLVNYERGTANAPSTKAVKRQWIQQNTDSATGLPTFKEYMSEWWFTNPSKQIGLDFAIPADESTLTPEQASKLETARANAAFGQEAVAQLGTFFGGLPGAVKGRHTVTAKSVTYGATPNVTVALENDHNRLPSGTVTLKVAGKSSNAAIADNLATFALPKLPAGKHAFTVEYAGDSQVLGFSSAGSLTVAKAKVAKTSGAVKKAPTTKKAGSYKVTVATASGLAKATGKVSVTLKKGKTSKKVTGTLKKGTVTLKVTKLAKGTWTAKVAYAGNANYSSASAAGAKVVVKK